MSKGNRSFSDRNKIAGLVSVLEERKTRLMEEDSSKVKKEPAWEKEYDSLILGDGPKGTYSMDPQVSQVNNNVLVIAGTGGGKTKSVVEANLLHAFHQSMVVLLTKRRLLDEYGPLLKSRGYDVRVLDLVHPERSDVGYDPMLHLSEDTDIIGLAKALVFASGCTSTKDPYWENSAADLFTGFLRLAKMLHGDKARMADVLERVQKIDHPAMIEEDDCEDMDLLRILSPVDQFYALRDKDPQMFMSWYQYYKNGENARACIRSIMVSAVNGVLTRGIQKIMAMPEQLEFTDRAVHPHQPGQSGAAPVRQPDAGHLVQGALRVRGEPSGRARPNPPDGDLRRLRHRRADTELPAAHQHLPREGDRGDDAGAEPGPAGVHVWTGCLRHHPGQHGQHHLHGRQ